jgi:hypothetical protein
LIYTYLAGTSTPAATYTSSTGSTAHANPIVLDAAGRIATGEVWLTTGVDYKFLVKTSVNVQLGSYDNIPSINDFTAIYAALANTANIALGDALIGFKQSNSSGVLSGAVGKTVHQKLQESVSVKDFGATGDGTTDDTTAVSAALTAAITYNVALYIPSGTYKLTAKITKSAATKISIIGDGRGLSNLYWLDGASAGLDLTYTDNLYPVNVQGLSFWVGTLATGTALKISGPETASVTNLGPSVSDLEIRGYDKAADCWDIGIHFYTCWYILLDQVSIKGQNDATEPFAQTAGIKLTSCQVCFMTKFTIVHVQTGILEAASGVATHGEGFCFNDFEMVGVSVGIDLSADGNAPGTNIGFGHINAYSYGIKLANQYQTAIHDLLLYKVNISTSNYTAISLAGCWSNIIHDNQIHGSATATGTMFGIVLSNGSIQNIIHDNNFQYFYGTGLAGIVMGNDTDKNYIHNNSCDATLTSIVLINNDALKNNVFNLNLPSSIQQLTINSTTPSVGNDLSGQWFFNNSVATTVTNFIDSYQTQKITIVSTTANTTIQNNANIILNGGINFVMAANNVITLQRESTIWREISRSA